MNSAPWRLRVLALSFPSPLLTSFDFHTFRPLTSLPSPSIKSVTREDVARAAGVSTYTVSQVVAGRAGPSDATRERVLKIAAELNYRPNLAASVLSSLGNSTRGKSKFKIGFLHGNSSSENLNVITNAAKEFDVMVHSVDLREFSSPETAGRVLYNQGFDGLAISGRTLPWSAEQRARFPWHKFALFKIDRVLPDIRCSLIRVSAFDFVNFTLEKLSNLGFRHIAVVLAPNPVAWDDDARFGAVYNYRERKLRPGQTLTLHSANVSYPHPFDRATLDWIEAQTCEVVVFFHRWMAENYFRQVPPERRHRSVAAFHTDNDGNSNPYQVAGCNVSTHERYRVAIRSLIEAIRHGRRGFNDYVTETVIEPRWFEGQTLHPPGEPTSP